MVALLLIVTVVDDSVQSTCHRDLKFSELPIEIM